jgi:hypothetical protein
LLERIAGTKRKGCKPINLHVKDTE